MTLYGYTQNLFGFSRLTAGRSSELCYESPSINLDSLHSESFGKPGAVRNSLSGRIADQYSTEPASVKPRQEDQRPN